MSHETQTHRESEDLRDVIEHYAALTDGWFWESDEQHKITYVSRGVEELVGPPPEFFIGRSRVEYSLSDSLDPAAWQQHKDDLNNRRPVRNFSYKFRGPKGERWIRVDGNPIFAKDGRFLGYRGIAKDVTAQVESENMAAALTEAIDYFPSPVCVWGPDNRLASFNAAFLDSIPEMPEPVRQGMPYDTFIRQLAEHGLIWRDREKPEDWVGSRIERQHVRPDRAIVRMKTGKTYRIEKRPLANGSTISLSVDLTDILAAQEEAQATRRKLTEALNALDTPFAYYDAEDRLSDWNDAFTEMNIGIRDLLQEGTPFETLLDAMIERRQIAGIEGREEEFRQARLLQHRQSNIRSERRISDGRWFMVREIETSDGGIVGIWTDISELKAKQAELEYAREAAEEASRLKSGFLANISHELRTPLNSISGFVHMLEERDLAEQDQLLVSRLASSTDMLIALVNDLLDLSLAEAGELRVKQSDFAVRSVLDDVARLLGPIADGKGIAFQTQIAADVPPVLLGDRMRIRQILLNFADNAVKFTHDGEVRINVSLAGPMAPNGTGNADILFEISDTGIGIPSDSLKSVFAPFFQADASSTREFGGAGLGLTISKKLADLMGGVINIESTVGKGTSLNLRLTLPVARTLEQPADATGVAVPVTALSDATILVVDDQSLNRQVLRSVLTRAGCTVYEAVNGEEAVNIIASSKPHFFDAILMDIQMPKMDGLAATRAILAGAKGNAPPIIALTAHTMESERRKCIAAGMCDHVQKPVDPNLLFAALARWTSGRRESHRPTPSPAPSPAPSPLNETAVSDIPAAEAPKKGASFSGLVQQLTDAIEDEELARELLAEFADTYGDAADRLRGFLDANNLPDAKDFAHRLKGVSGNLRLIDLHDAALRLESRLASTPNQPDEIHEAMDMLSAVHTQIVDTIHTSGNT